MSYRIWLHVGEYRRIELFNDLNLENFPIIEGTQEDEYPCYKVYKDELKNILIQYQYLLRDNAKHKMKKQTSVSEDLQSCIEYHYFKKLIDNELLIQDSDSFLLQYFYLVNMYKKMNHETFFKITHAINEKEKINV